MALFSRAAPPHDRSRARVPRVPGRLAAPRLRLGPAEAAAPLDDFRAAIVQSVLSVGRVASVTSLTTRVTFDAGTARFSLPLCALLDDAGALVCVSLGEPWTSCAPTFRLEAGEVKIEVPQARETAWQTFAPNVELTWADGRSELVSLQYLAMISSRPPSNAG
jgi:hypothetical protein